MLEDGEVGDAVELGDADADDEAAQGGGGDAAAAQAGEGGHAGIVPAGDDLLVHEREQLALGDQGVAGHEFRELVLAGQGAGEVEGLEDPVVERAVVHEL